MAKTLLDGFAINIHPSVMISFNPIIVRFKTCNTDGHRIIMVKVIIGYIERFTYASTECWRVYSLKYLQDCHYFVKR
jgi:hypothetical protein